MGYALIQDGQLSGASKVKKLVGDLDKTYASRDATGPADASGVHTTGRPTFLLEAQGVYESASGVFDLPTGSGGAALTVTGSPFFRVSRAQVVRSAILENTTGAEDAFGASVFTPGKPNYFGTMTGWLADDGTTFKDLTETGSTINTLTLPLDASREITGEARILSMRPRLEGPKGGSILTPLGFIYTGAVTVTNTPLASSSYTATIHLDQGQTWTATVQLEQVGVDIDYTNATRTLVQIKGMFSGAITIA